MATLRLHSSKPKGMEGEERECWLGRGITSVDIRLLVY
jgi:hypothetical protein